MHTQGAKTGNGSDCDGDKLFFRWNQQRHLSLVFLLSLFLSLPKGFCEKPPLSLIFCYFNATHVFQGQRDESTKVDKEMAKNDSKELQEVTRKALIEQRFHYNN